MMRSIRSLAIATLALSLVAVSACHKKPIQVAPAPAPPPPPPPPGPNVDSIAKARAREDSIRAAQALAAKLAADKADSLRKAQDAANAAAADAAKLRATLVTVVHFEYDKSDLRDEDKAALDAKIPILQANPTVMLTLAGHTDERGSDEYNLALGVRRASTAKAYLVDRGIAASRLQTISYGEERPLCQQEDESCFAQNRRVEFQITAGPAILKR
jgi:peptidoglycan-associated lipoprotein